VTSRKVLLLRHGETEFHAENRYAGVTDLPLNETGRRQADRVGVWAATTKICSLWCSDLQRAIETTAPLVAATGLNPVVDARFRELDFGRGEGLTQANMRTEFPREREAFETDPYANPLPLGESGSAALARAREAFEDAIDQTSSAAKDELLVIVSHSTLLRLLVTDLIGAPLSSYRKLFPSIPPASGIAITTNGRRAGILAVNPDLKPGWRA
jgi:broad specificity phosphatase PhoE